MYFFLIVYKKNIKLWNENAPLGICIAASTNSNFSMDDVIAPTSAGSVSLGIIIGAVLGGVLLILIAFLSLLFRLKVLSSYTSTFQVCMQCCKHQVNSKLHKTPSYYAMIFLNLLLFCLFATDLSLQSARSACLFCIIVCLGHDSHDN